MASPRVSDPVTVTLAYLPMSASRQPVRLRITQPAGAGQRPWTVYSGSVKPRDRLSFVSLRRPPAPYSVSAYVDDVLTLKTSVCCERRRPIGSRLGGAAGCLLVFQLRGGVPCSRCQAAEDRLVKLHKRRMDQLDKKLRAVIRVGRGLAPTATGHGTSAPEPRTHTEKQQNSNDAETSAAAPPNPSNEDETENYADIESEHQLATSSETGGAAAAASALTKTEATEHPESEPSSTSSETEASDDEVAEEEPDSGSDESSASDVEEELLLT